MVKKQFLCVELNEKQVQQLEDDFLESDIVNGDLIAVSFATVQGTVKVFNQNGDCLNTIYRNDKDWNVCLETMKVLKYYPQSTFGENQQYALVMASDNRTIQVHTNKLVYKIENAHQGMIRGLAIWEVNDGLNLKNIILSAADNDHTIKLWDGLDGQLLKEIKSSHSGLRWRSLHCYQENYKPTNKNYIVYGSKHGTLFIFSLPIHKK
ncbi:hypothetical protein IMG5_166030 [Ichthyophthirius multifiliis]|uniref:WD repeat protein n=1 Tax=Ichthyophthirius multifiliis TaxID=5932 RepID=G0R0P5_ICHMU|nr:hypothetical protein IMG5_166030 [Ichthyophthirius multifiliis]EGR28960.1 hypothetical protein IMG5_166030 [Ichthyophthirius multifiliis]|eukprot:XP_004030196.1 hypothetical protein IMG5_166030 [Ichthyophthirius multifiliis]